MIFIGERVTNHSILRSEMTPKKFSLQPPNPTLFDATQHVSTTNKFVVETAISPLKQFEAD